MNGDRRERSDSVMIGGSDEREEGSGSLWRGQTFRTVVSKASP